MNYYKLSNNNTITLNLGYFISLVSLVTIVCLWISLDIVANYYKSNVSYELVKSYINQKNYESALELSIKRLAPNMPNIITSKIFKSFPSINTHAKERHFPSTFVSKDVLNKVFFINTFLKKDNFKEASKQFDSVESSLKSLSITDNKDISKLLKKTKASFNTLKLESVNLKNFKTDYDDLNAEKTRLIRRHELLSDEFGIFLSLEPQKGRGKEFNVYKMGVLTGLPVLRKLKDNIASLLLLKEELDRVGGSVNIEAPNAYEVFMGRLTSLKETSERLRREYKSTVNEMEILKKEESETKKVLNENKTKISEYIEKLVIMLNDN